MKMICCMSWLTISFTPSFYNYYRKSLLLVNLTLLLGNDWDIEDCLFINHFKIGLWQIPMLKPLILLPWEVVHPTTCKSPLPIFFLVLSMSTLLNILGMFLLLLKLALLVSIVMIKKNSIWPQFCFLKNVDALALTGDNGQTTYSTYFTILGGAAPGTTNNTAASSASSATSAAASHSGSAVPASSSGSASSTASASQTTSAASSLKAGMVGVAGVAGVVALFL